MPLAIGSEHEELRRTVARWVETHCPPAVVRAACEAPAGELPPVWKEIAAEGWLGLHVPEECGGQGFGVTELAVVLEELGAALAPGPLLPTLVVTGIVERYGTPECRERWLPGLVDGSVPAAVSMGADVLIAGSDGPVSPDGTVVPDGTVSGTLGCVLGAPVAKLILAPLSSGGWCLIDAEAGELSVENRTALDSGRPLGTVSISGSGLRPEVFDGIGVSAVHDLVTILSAAECAGGARWCLDTASDYAKARVQFGRPIGQFQAIKHRLAGMLVAVEQAAAVAWDTARAWDEGGEEVPLAAAVAGTVAVESFVECAKSCVQVLGGIGFTWEHDAHLYLKRAIATRQLLGGTASFRREVAGHARRRARRTLVVDLPAEAEEIRARAAEWVAGAAALHGEEKRSYLVEHGLIAPHWPAPWGRDAGALEQLVIDEEMKAAGVRRPHLGVGAWVLPTLISHGTVAQRERWVRPTLLGTLHWCQLFSEPGAGSDLASLTTRAEKVDRGWRITGQKVWTSMATAADYGVCLARSDPDVPRHEGISYFVVDMKVDGVDVRPLREMTGQEMFSEVFLDGVFVPDDALIGSPGEGWRIARTTLANERVSMSSGATFGTGVEALVEMVGADADVVVLDGTAVALGALAAEAQSLRLIAFRDALRSLVGAVPGAESSVRKLLGAEHEQRVQEFGLELCGVEGALADSPPVGRWVQGFLATRCLTIAGGTSEIQRNVMAERILGQPRDPEPGE